MSACVLIVNTACRHVYINAEARLVTLAVLGSWQTELDMTVDMALAVATASCWGLMTVSTAQKQVEEKTRCCCCCFAMADFEDMPRWLCLSFVWSCELCVLACVTPVVAYCVSRAP
jgi:hypothetical protein